MAIKSNKDIENSDSLEFDANSEASDNTVIEPGSAGSNDDKSDSSKDKKDGKSDNKDGKISLRQRLHINRYMWVFVVVLVIGVAITIFGYTQSRSEPSTQTSSLSEESLQSLRDNESQVGDAGETLTVSSNSVFNGRVLVRDDLDVAGTINVGGDISLPGITVSGNSSFDEVQVARNLSIGGDTNIQGALVVDGGLTVSGNATFSGSLSAGSLTVDSLNLSSDLNINRHIDGGGGIPAAVVQAAAGSGATTNINGSDTAGTININTGTGATTGTLAIVTFANTFNQKPNVVLSPSSSGAASSIVYITKTNTGFSIIATGTVPSGALLSFDFVAID